MIFNELSQRYFHGPETERLRSVIEFSNGSGPLIGGNETLLQSTFLARGNGSIEFRRRGDFMERPDAFPGVWNSKCDPSDLAGIWTKLGDLGPESFPARVADPGDSMSRLTAYLPDQVESLSWGPP